MSLDFELYFDKIIPMSKNSAHYKQKTQNPSLKLPKAILSSDRNTQHATRNTQHATRNTQHATRNTQHATQLYTSSKLPCQLSSCVFLSNSFSFLSLFLFPQPRPKVEDFPFDIGRIYEPAVRAVFITHSLNVGNTIVTHIQ